jgi:4-carboxymuconolactone decarboxylase
MLGAEAADGMVKAATSGEFAGEMGELALDSVFGALWTRPGLSRRDRSLVTLGILIALRASGELRYHFPIALRNGLTKDELAEVIYHCTGYAGFPAAASASVVAKEILAGK